MGFEHRYYLKRHEVPTEYRASVRHEYVLAACTERTQRMIVGVLADLVPEEIAWTIARHVYDERERCRCEHSWTCSLCYYACCRRAYRFPCTCSVCFACPHHGITHFGVHPRRLP